jgi:hypothetical protein
MTRLEWRWNVRWFRRVGEKNSHPGSVREVYLNWGPNEMAMYVEGRRYCGIMVLVAGEGFQS